MHNTYKHGTVLIITALLSLSAIAQKRTYSPYSRYGIGDIEDGGFGRNAGMGRTGIALTSSNHLNNINPASYSSMDSLSFFFEAGMLGIQQNIKNPQSSYQFNDMNFDYFAIGFPVAKHGFVSLGFQPVTSVGYDFYEDNNLTNSDPDYSISTATGSGNTTRAYIGLSLSPVQNLSLGAHFTYLFGTTRSQSLGNFPNSINSSMLGSSQTMQVNDFYLDFGLQYKLELNERNNLVFGVVYKPQTGIRAKVTKFDVQGSALNQEGTMLLTGDTIQYIENHLDKSAFEMPEKFGFGIAYNLKDELTLTADYTIEKWGDIDFPDEITQTTDMTKYAFGAEYIPNERSSSFYPARIRYRLGTYYKNDYRVINDNQLSDFGISFGVGLPLKRSKTSFNIAFEWGQRGTTSDNLVKENYSRLTMNLTLHETWFRKFKFD